MLDAAVETGKAKRCPGFGRVSSQSGFAELSGFLTLFQKRDFREVARAGSRRHVLRLEL
jgi:hypothetical protein